jgi:hypothetical protein
MADIGNLTARISIDLPCTHQWHPYSLIVLKLTTDRQHFLDLLAIELA